MDSSALQKSYRTRKKLSQGGKTRLLQVGVGIDGENTVEGVCRRPPQETSYFGKEAVRGYAGKTCIYVYLSNQENPEL